MVSGALLAVSKDALSEVALSMSTGCLLKRQLQPFPVILSAHGGQSGHFHRGLHHAQQMHCA